MTRKEAFNHIYLMNHYPEEYKDAIFPLFEIVYNLLTQRLKESNLDVYIIEPDIVVNYICQEHFNNMLTFNENQRSGLLENKSYLNRLITIVCDKIFINEIQGYENPTLINPYNPLITTYQFFFEFYFKSI